MACLDLYGTADGFAAMFCVGDILAGADNSGANNNAFLTDSQMDFVRNGVKANIGMILYNLTDGSSGPVTAVAEHTLTATLAGGTENDWDNGDRYQIVLIDASQRATIEMYLGIVASDINAARAASGGCDCTLASWAAVYLAKLAYIEAAVMHNCPCGRANLSDEMKRAYLEWVTAQLALIRQGQIELCEGSTGSEFPAVGYAELGLTEFSTERIIINATARSS